MEVVEELVGEDQLLGALSQAHSVGIDHRDLDRVPWKALQEGCVAEFEPVEISRTVAAREAQDRRQSTAFGHKGFTDLAGGP